MALAGRSARFETIKILADPVVSSVTGYIGSTSHWRDTTHARSAREVESKMSHLVAHFPAF